MRLRPDLPSTILLLLCDLLESGPSNESVVTDEATDIAVCRYPSDTSVDQSREEGDEFFEVPCTDTVKRNEAWSVQESSMSAQRGGRSQGSRRRGMTYNIYR